MIEAISRQPSAFVVRRGGFLRASRRSNAKAKLRTKVAEG
jgi:hypothetical protein